MPDLRVLMAVGVAFCGSCVKIQMIFRVIKLGLRHEDKEINETKPLIISRYLRMTKHTGCMTPDREAQQWITASEKRGLPKSTSAASKLSDDGFMSQMHDMEKRGGNFQISSLCSHQF